MKNRVAVAALAAIISSAIAVPALAGPRAADPDITRQEVAAFDAYLDQHSTLARQLQANPALVDNEEFVEHHRDFADFMQDHPRIREELREHPGQFVWARDHFEWTERADEIPAGEVADLDRFLDRHREAADALRANPSLVSNEEFMENHPGLAQFLENHPDLRARLQRHPDMVMWREAQYESAEEQTPHHKPRLERHADRRD